jgi:uncharacterized membrane protein YphA (DoxX/SURF4 family)
MLVLLRLTIGWHFLYQGLAKYEDPNFSSVGFLGQAKGPLGDKYRELLLDDWDGRRALDPAPESRKKFSERIDAALKQFEDFYKPGKEQLAAAQQAAAARKLQIESYLQDNAEDIEKYLHGLERLDEAKKSPSRNTPFQQKRIWDEQLKLQGEAKAWLGELDRIDREFRQDLDSLLAEDQRARGAPPAPLGKLRQIDLAVTYGVMAIGACLLVGLFTRLASFSGALFLLSIVLAQPDWPGLYPSPHPAVGRSLFVNKEFVEMMALFFLATTHVGRWGGLDFFIHHLIVRPLAGRRETT